MISTIRRRLTGESGQALVELVLVFAFGVIPLILVVADVARALHFLSEETHLSELGARYASVGSWPGSDGTNPTTALFSTLCSSINDRGLNNNDVTIRISAPDGNQETKRVQVDVNTNYPWVRYATLALNVSSTLAGSATMRLEAPFPGALPVTFTCPHTA